MQRILLNFSVTRLDDMVAKGNVWYALHYRQFFDRYICAYVLGPRMAPLERDGVCLVSLGTGRPLLDLVLSPIRVYGLARRSGATDFLSADLAYAWWHFILVRLLLGGRLMAMPVCTPSEILQLTGKTYSGLPTWIERGFIRMTFMMANRILCVETDKTGIEWVRTLDKAEKLKIVPVLPEEFPTVDFMDLVRDCSSNLRETVARKNPPQLVYVGRLENEKLVDDLIDVAVHLRESGRAYVLRIVGDGTERSRLERRVAEEGVQGSVVFYGYMSSIDVAKILSNSDLFVSPYTGTSLREAALMGLPIVAYRLGFVGELLRDGENCLMASGGDTKGMAKQIVCLLDDPQRAYEIGAEAKRFADRLWSPASLRNSLNLAFN